MSTSLWVKRTERWRLNANGTSELIERWEGPAGAANATRDAWLGTKTGWKSVEFSSTIYSETGDGVVTADLVWAVDTEGTPVPVNDPEYGLIRRDWRLEGSDEQLPIEHLPQLQALEDAKPGWLKLIEQYVQAYKSASRAAMETFPWGAASPSEDAWPKYGAGEDWIPAGTATAPAGATADQILHANYYAALLLAQPEYTIPVAAYVLSKVETVQTDTALRVSHESVGRHLSYAALTRLEPSLPTYPLLVLADLDDLIWLKLPPTVSLSSGGNAELSQDYHGFTLPESGSQAAALMEFIFGAVIAT